MALVIIKMPRLQLDDSQSASKVLPLPRRVHGCSGSMRPVVMGRMITFLDYLNPGRVQGTRLLRETQILPLPATAGADRVRPCLPAGPPPDRRAGLSPGRP